MLDDFLIAGTSIPLSSIKNFSILQREYIYRPSYIEKTIATKTMFNSTSYQEYKFDRMVPYAAILNEKEYRLAIRKAEAFHVGQAILKDIAVGTISFVADKINIRSKRFCCMNVSGRVFTTFLDEIPALVVRGDGRIYDVYKKDAMDFQLDDNTQSAILIVPALSIKTKEELIFYGNDIQIHDVEYEYKRLYTAMSDFKDQRQQTKALPGIKKVFSLPKKNENVINDIMIEEKEDVNP